MDQTLMDLRQRETEASTEYLKVQRAYLKAAAPHDRKPETALKEAAEECRRAAEPYDAALRDLLEYLLTMEPAAAILAEIDRTERLIDALNKEKKQLRG